jgi:hypothetical protein
VAFKTAIGQYRADLKIKIDFVLGRQSGGYRKIENPTDQSEG